MVVVDFLDFPPKYGGENINFKACTMMTATMSF